MVTCQSHNLKIVGSIPISGNTIINKFNYKKNKMLTLNLSYLLKLTTLIFCAGALGLILNRKNILVALMCIELLLLSVNLNFILFSLHLDDIFGSLFILFVLTIAASESALGLAILTTYYKLKSSILLEPIKTNKFKI